MDQHVVERMNQLRGPKLPKETGGVLIGSLDMLRKRIYVVDVIASPADSKEEHNCYERGIVGLEEAVRNFQSRSANHLEYVGEWHSHPQNCATRASGLDEELLSKLNDARSTDGRPALMAIIGDNAKTAWYVNEVTDPFIYDQVTAEAEIAT